MIKDYDFALIELTEEEAQKFETDESYKAQVIAIAEDISDETDRTVEIRCNGKLIDSVSAA